MKINLSDKILAYLTLTSGLSISAVAVWYSVAGLVSIFAASAVPIIIMGVVLEVGKLVATVWLKVNWRQAPVLIRTYLIIAITILMLITSMGIFGFLSKAHLDQAVPTGDVAAKVSIIDEKIKTERDNIEASRKALTQMDSAVDQTMARSTSEQGADKAAALRRSQARERTTLQADIAKAQKNIAALNQERAPIASELRKVEAEVGPIKYIAALIYGDNPDANLLEAAVRWVIIIIVMVFDPLAVILLLASQYSFQWFRKQEEENAGLEIFAGNPDIVMDPPKSETPVTALGGDITAPESQLGIDIDPYAYLKQKWSWKVPGVEPVGPQVYQPEIEEPPVVVAGKDPSEPGWMFTAQHEADTDDHEIIAGTDGIEAQEMAAWKHDHPLSSLKMQRRLLKDGSITKLPWEGYLTPKADFDENEAAAEALKWAQEQLEERPGDYIREDEVKKKSDLDGTSGQSASNTNSGGIAGYVQNAEQSEKTIWQRVQDAKKGV